jgi:hypothetical protein
MDSPASDGTVVSAQPSMRRLRAGLGREIPLASLPSTDEPIEPSLVMFSGGRDSTLAALRLHQEGMPIALVTITSNHLVGIERVLRRLSELSSILPAETRWFQVRQSEELRTDTSFYEQTCLSCHHAYVVASGALAMRSPRPNYAHNAIPVMLSGIKEGAFENREELDPQALAIAVKHQGQGNKLLANLSGAFLKAGFSVQYLSASRHPIEFVGYLKRHLEDDGVTWQSVARRIVVIDAYSPHFAFIDSIYPKKDRELESLNVTRVVSKMTFAGMHSASSRAFKVIQKQVGDADRKPTLVIYEDCYALSDLESPEQYRIFVRHVLPSERLWDGMFIVFLESGQPDGDWNCCSHIPA